MNIRWVVVILLFYSFSDCNQPSFNYEEEGLASYYHDALEGNLTANGETFSQDSLTAAHRTLPFDTRIKVTNPENDKFIWVTINDRGPFNYKRIIDLSKRAVDSLDLIHQGIGKVILHAQVSEEWANVDSD